jgi:hypothetical protein
MKLTHLSTRIVLAGVLVAVAAALGASARAATDAATAQRAALCPPAGALVTYAPGGTIGARSIVVRPDGRVWLGVTGAAGDVTRAGFVLSGAELALLRADLRQISVHHLGPAPKRACSECSTSVSSLVLRGTTLPWAGRQPSPAGASALLRAELMLDLLAEQRIAGE